MGVGSGDADWSDPLVMLFMNVLVQRWCVKQPDQNGR